MKFALLCSKVSFTFKFTNLERIIKKNTHSLKDSEDPEIKDLRTQSYSEKYEEKHRIWIRRKKLKLN